MKSSSSNGISLSPDMSDPAMFSVVFRRYYSGLCYFANKFVGDAAEDVVEELFVRLWRKRTNFETEDHLKAFLYRSTKNACLDFIKTSERSGMRNTLFASEHGYNEESYINEIIRAEVIREIYQAIEHLPPQCGKIITMSYVDGKTNQEIAEELNLSVQTVKNQKGRGLSILKNRLPHDKYLMLLIIPYLHLFDLFHKN